MRRKILSVLDSCRTYDQLESWTNWIYQNKEITTDDYKFYLDCRAIKQKHVEKFENKLKNLSKNKNFILSE